MSFALTAFCTFSLSLNFDLVFYDHSLTGWTLAIHHSLSLSTILRRLIWWWSCRIACQIPFGHFHHYLNDHRGHSRMLIEQARLFALLVIFVTIRAHFPLRHSHLAFFSPGTENTEGERDASSDVIVEIQKKMQQALKCEVYRRL